MKKICLSCKKKFEGKANAKTCSPKCRKRLERTMRKADSEAHKLEQRVGELGRNALTSFKKKILEIESLDSKLADNQAGFAVIPHVPPVYSSQVVKQETDDTNVEAQPVQTSSDKASESIPVRVMPVAPEPKDEVKDADAGDNYAGSTESLEPSPTPVVEPKSQVTTNSTLSDWSLPQYELESSGLPKAESLEPVEPMAKVESSAEPLTDVVDPVARTTNTTMPEAADIQMNDNGDSKEETNQIASYISNEPKPEGKKRLFSGVIFKAAAVSLVLTMLVGTIGLRFANRSSSSINGNKNYPSQDASSSVNELANSLGVANASEVAEIQVNGNGTFTGNIRAANLSGNGSQLVNLNASNLATGTISDSRLSANVTLQGNAFNGAGQLVKADSQGRLPAIDGSQLLNLPGSNVDPNTTIQGNTFNGANQLVQLEGSGYLPALNGSLLTSLDASNLASGTLDDLRLSTNVTIQGNTFNGANQLVQLNPSGDLPAVSGINLTNLNASSVSAGTLNDLRLSTNVTIQGNTFNGANQLVQLSSLGFYPALNGSLITNIAAGNIVTGTLSDSRLSANVALLDSSQNFTGTNTFNNSVVAPGLQSSGAILDVGTAGATLNLLGDLSSNLAVKSGAYTTTIGFSGSPIGDVNYVFDVAATPGTYTICTDVGNCTGSGGGVSTLGGTLNKLAKFTAAQVVADSIISDDGTTVTIQPTANSTNSFQIQNQTGTSNLLIADTSNTRIGIGKAPTAGVLDVNGSIYQNGNQVCDTSGNCVGTGGGGSIGGGGTSGTISVFTGSGYTLADSILSQVSTTVTATGNLNVTGQYKVNGSQIASTDLSDSSDLAKLSGTGPQTFMGNNKFTGTLVAQNGVNSTTAFQIQNAAGSSNLFIADTTNSRIGIGVLPGYTLDVNGDINIAAGGSYRINGVAICGPSAVCAPASGSNNYIQNSVAAQTDANFNIVSVNSGSVVGILRGASGQTADLLRLQDENGANVVTFANDGALTLGQTSVVSGVVKLTNTGGSGTIALSPSNPGSSSYTLTLPAETGTVCTTASLCAGYGAASGSGSYIQNTTSLQSSANFNISGNGTIVGQLRVGDPSTATGTVKFYNTSGSGAITVTPANPGSANYTLTLPAETGTVCTTGSVCSGYASSAAAFIQNGNSYGTTATLGTNDNNNLGFETNGTTRLIINSTGEIRTESNDIKLKTGGDAAHGLGYYGSGKTYNSIVVDGPVLYGYSGGILGGSQTYGQPGALRWSNDARVVIGSVTSTPDAQLQVVSRSTSSGSMTITASNGSTTMTTSSSTTLKAGDYIVPTTSTGQARQIATTAFGTSFTVTQAYSANVTAETFTIYPAVLKLTSTSGSSQLIVQGYTGFVGIGTTTPANLLGVNTATTADSTAQALLATGGTGNKGLVVQGVSGQTADFFNVQKYDGSQLFRIKSNGSFTATSATNYANLDFNAPSAELSLGYGGAVSGSIILQDGAGGGSAPKLTASSGQLIIQNQSTNYAGVKIAGPTGSFTSSNTLTVVASSGQTGKVLEIQNSSSTPVMSISATGAALFQNSANSTTALQVYDSSSASVFNVDTSNHAVTIKGKAGQTTDYFNIKNSSNVNALSVVDDGSGNITLNGGVGGADLTVHAGYALQLSSGVGRTYLHDETYSMGGLRVFASSLYFDAGYVAPFSTSSVGLPIKALSSQTADLLQLQDSSSNVNAAFNSTGAQLTLGRASNVTGSLVVKSSSGSGSITLSPANPGSTAYTLTLPAENGTVCTTGSVCSGYQAVGSYLTGSTGFIQGGNSFGADAVLGTNDTNNLVIRTNGTTRLTIDQSNAAYFGNGVTNASPTDFTLQATGGSGSNIAGAALNIAGGKGTGTGVGGNIVFQYAPAGLTGSSLNSLQTACSISGTNGSLSCPDGSNSERFGAGSVATSTYSVAIGNGASATGGNNSVAIGYGATTTTNRGTAVGRGTSASLDGVSLGDSASSGAASAALGSGATAAAYSVAIGNGATTTGSNSVAIGLSASAAANQLVIGGVTTGYFGNGVTNASPTDFTLQATGGSGTNIAGAAFTLAGGKGTGTGNGGDLLFQTAKPSGSSGSSLNSLQSVLTLSGTNGSALFQNSTNSTTAFQVKNAAGTSVLVVNTSTGDLTVARPGGLGGVDGAINFGTGSSNIILSSNTYSFSNRIAVNDSTLSSVRVNRASGGSLDLGAASFGQFSSLSTDGDAVVRADSTASDLIMTVTNNTGNIIFGTGATDTAKLTIQNAGNILINSGDLVFGTAGTQNIGSATAEINNLYVGDDNGIRLGLDQDALLAYDEAGDDRVELTGTNASLFVEDRLGLGVDARTINDNTVGSSAATLTLNPNSSYVKITCNDPDGCNVTMDEASPVKDGNIVYVVNTGTNTVNFADTANVSELAGAYAAGQYDSIQMLYSTDRWVEVSRSNN